MMAYVKIDSILEFRETISGEKGQEASEDLLATCHFYVILLELISEHPCTFAQLITVFTSHGERQPCEPKASYWLM